MRNFFLLLFLVPLFCNASCPHRLNFGPDIYWRDYDEVLTPPAKSHEFGFLYGLQVGYQYIEPCCYYWGADLRSSIGVTVYDGSLQNLNTGEISPYRNNTYNFFLNAEVRFGKTYRIGRSLLIPFVGIGYHNWFRGAAPNNPYGYDEQYDWEYAAVGLRTEYEINCYWTIGLNLKLLQMINGQMYSSDLNDAAFRLGNVPQYEVEIPLTYTLSRPMGIVDQISFVPYYRNQNIGQSNVQTAFLDGIGTVQLVEPGSITHIVGLRLEFIHTF